MDGREDATRLVRVRERSVTGNRRQRALFYAESPRSASAPSRTRGDRCSLSERCRKSRRRMQRIGRHDEHGLAGLGGPHRVACGRGDRHAGRSARGDARSRRSAAERVAIRCRRCGTGSTSCRWPSAIGDRPRRPCEARRLPAAGAAAAAHVGRRPADVPATAARRRARSSAPRRIVDITTKDGRSGPLVFVRVRHDIAGPRGPRDHRGARHRLPRRCRAPGERAGHAASARRRRGVGAHDPIPTTCCCSAIRR